MPFNGWPIIIIIVHQMINKLHLIYLLLITVDGIPVINLITPKLAT